MTTPYTTIYRALSTPRLMAGCLIGLGQSELADRLQDAMLDADVASAAQELYLSQMPEGADYLAYSVAYPQADELANAILSLTEIRKEVEDYRDANFEPDDNGYGL